MTFVERPISGVCLVLAALMLIGPMLPSLRKKREVVALEPLHHSSVIMDWARGCFPSHD
jgi:TctA family transporter